jgi:parallel beta-helix repeat protein
MIMKRNFYCINLIGRFFCFFLLAFFSSHSNAYPAYTDYLDTVQKAYIGYLQRPADPEGLIYWAERLDASDGNLNEIIEAFAHCDESQALYGTIDSSNISTVVNSIYNALFGRSAETAGLDFWVDGFNAGTFTAATIMLNVLYGAQNEDLQSVNNKLTAANLFTRTIDPDLDGKNFQATYAGDGDAIAGRNFITLYATSVKVPTQDEITAYIRANIANPGDGILTWTSVRTVNGDWIVSGQQIVENEKVIINGQVRVLANASLVVKNAALEINYPSDTFNLYDPSGNTSLRVERGGAIKLSDSSISAVQPRAMISAEFPGQIDIQNCIFQNFEMSVHAASQAVIAGNAFTLQPDQGVAAAIQFFNASAARISGNNIVGVSSPNKYYRAAARGIDLLNSDQNDVRDNIIVGTSSGISLNSCNNNQIVGNSWTGPKSRQGEGGIGLQNWSNNNVIENNTLDNAGSAILFIWQSKHNKISGNIIRNAGLGIVLRWVSDNTIAGNILEHIWEDGIRAYRSYNNVIANNQISDGGEGISLFSSWDNQLGGNVITTVDRGFYLFDAQTNQIQGNEVRETVQSALVVQSASNALERNNFIQSQITAIEESASGANNTWQENYWENAPYAIVDSSPATQAWSVSSFAVPNFQPIVLDNMQRDVLSISTQVVWDGQTKTINGGISIKSGGQLVIRNSTLTYVPEGMQNSIWIEVLPGGVLDIEGSKIFGPEKDHTFAIKVYEDATITMKNSELHNAGSWVGTFGAAIAYQGKSAVIANNLFRNVYCAFSSEPPAANIQFLNNTIINTIEAVTIIGDAPNTVIDSNLFQQCAIWGIQVWSLTPNIGEVVRLNRVENSWGIGIYDALPGVITIEPNNTFANLKGPGLISPELLDARQFRTISITPTNVRAGNNVAITFKLMPLSIEPGMLGSTYAPSLSVNDVEIARREIDVMIGETAVVTLEGTATSAGVVKLTISAKWIF